jgi:Flp pilus assembly protein TadB
MEPGFMNPMFENRLCGWPMLGIGLALIGMGMAAIQKIVNIDI